MTESEEDSQVKLKMQTEIRDLDLRETLKAAMKGRTKGSTPRVTICKTQIPQISLLRTSSSCFLEEDNCHIDAMDLEAQYDDDDDDVNSAEIKQVIVSLTPINSELKKECDAVDDEAPQDSIEKKKLKCSFCRAEFREGNSGKGDWFRRQHVMQYHGDQLFPNSKLDSITDLQFKKIVGGLLFKDLIKEKCIYCNRRFRNTKKKLSHLSQVKRHLVKNHFEMLKQKLMKIQFQSKSLVESDLIGEVCECGAYLQNSSSRARHNAWHCPDKFQTSLVRPGTTCHTIFMSDFIMVSNKFKCKLCKKTFSNRCSARKHWQYYCPIREDKRLFIKKEVDSLICEYCGHECVRRGHITAKHAMKQHLVRKHPDHYFPSFSKGRNQEQLKAILERVLFPKFALKNGISMSCSVCGMKMKIKGKDRMQRHLINQHIQKLKESLKLILEEDEDSRLVKSPDNNFSEERKSLKSKAPGTGSVKIAGTGSFTHENALTHWYDNKGSDAINDIDPLGMDES